MNPEGHWHSGHRAAFGIGPVTTGDPDAVKILLSDGLTSGD